MLRGELPLAMPFLDLPARSAFLTPPGRFRLDVATAYESTHILTQAVFDQYASQAMSGRRQTVTLDGLRQVAASSASGNAYFVDGETLRLAIETSVRIGRRFEADLEVPILWHTGGFLDSTIESYHRTFGFPDGGRPPFERDRYVVGYVDRGRSVFLGDAPYGPGLGDAVIEGRATLLPGPPRRAALTAGLAVKVPTGSVERLDGSGSVDLGLESVASYRGARFSVSGGAQFVRIGPWTLDRRIDLTDQKAVFIQWAARAGAASSVVMQGRVSKGPFPDRAGSDLGQPAIEVALGMRHLVTERGSIELALLENLSRRFNTPDVGAFFGWSSDYRSMRPAP